MLFMHILRWIMARKRKILIVEDQEINRIILCNILEDDYDLLQACNGLEALNLLRSCKEDISLILLDLTMPVMDGYEFLDNLKKDPLMSAVPVIITTSNDSSEDEIRCLANGASDFVTKPYNPEVVRHRIASIIHLRESSAMLNMLEYDQLTGLYSREFFYQRVARVLEQEPDKQYDIICSDIENFKLVNERSGEGMGDELLRYVADMLRNHLGSNDLCARIRGDVFAFLVEHEENDLEQTVEQQVKNGYPNCPVPNLTIKYGIYENVNRQLPISVMCDRALLALRRIKNQYGKYIARYDDSLRLALLREQQIIDSMEQALAEHQFEVYFQPKHEIRTGNITGAEALVRWSHPQFGFMSPGEFIPLFERNGFISKLDSYVWNETCRYMRNWIDRGLPIVPISVNLSRADFDIPDLADQICRLTNDYNLDHSLLHLEITESAYTDNPQQIINTIHELRTLGFKIEMDDFGSGYSSLNMLSELPIDVLKMDMHFIQQKATEQNRSILNFIVSLSKWLNLITIAEGVETREQMEYLKSIGCCYVQGYYYAKPMPAAEFEEYLCKMDHPPIVPEITAQGNH